MVATLWLAVALAATQPGADECVVELAVPRETTVAVGGVDYSRQRRLSFKPLAPGEFYPTSLVATFGGGVKVERSLLLRGGWLVRVALPPPHVARPELVPQLGHQATRAAYAAGGRLLVSRGRAPRLVFWDAATGRELRRLDAALQYHDSLAVDPAGKLILADDNDESLGVWDAATGKLLRRIELGAGYADRATFAPDGRTAIAGGVKGGAVVFNIDTAEKLRTLEYGSLIQATAISPDGRLALVGGYRDEAALWEIASGEPAGKLGGHLQIVASVAFSGDGRWMATGGGRFHQPVGTGVAYLWEAGGRRVAALEGHGDLVSSVALAEDGRRIATGSADGKARVFEGPSGRLLRAIDCGLWVTEVRLVDSGRFLLTTTPKSIDLWDAEQGTLKTSYAARGTFPWFAMPDDRRSFLSSATGRTIVRRDLATGEMTGRLFDGEAMHAPAISGDGRIAVAVTPDNRLRVWDVERGKRLFDLAGHRDYINSVAVNGDGTRAISASFDDTAVLWNLKDGSKRLTLPVDVGAGAAQFHPDGRRAVVTAYQKAIVWDLDSGDAIRSFGEYQGFGVPCLRPGGRQVLVGANKPELALYDIDTGQSIRRLTPSDGDVWALAFSGDGRLAVAGYGDGSLVLWDVDAGTPLRRFCGPPAIVKSVGFCPGGRQLLSAGSDGAIRLWDIASGDCVATMLQTGDSGDWLATTAEGCFDGSEAGRQGILFRIGGGLNVVPVDRFFQDFYRPGLWELAIVGERLLPEVKLGTALPPTIRIVAPAAGEVAEAKVRVDVEVRDAGGGIGNLALFHNGAKVLAEGESRREGPLLRRSFAVELVDGSNRLRVSAATADGAWEAEPAELLLQHAGASGRSRLWLVAVGINEFAERSLNLEYAASDAQAIAAVFSRRGQALYESVDVTTLVDRAATRDRIRQTLKEKALASRPQDSLLLFMAGHGVMIGQRYYFLPHDTKKESPSLEEDVRRQGLPADELSDLLGRARALKRMMALDTCASGGALAMPTRGRSGLALRGAIERLSRSQGIFTIAASAPSEEAQESRELKHGVLTYALLAGLNAADHGPLAGQHAPATRADATVDVMEWFSFASGQVPRLTEKLFGSPQEVQTSTYGSSFPVLPLE